MTSDDWIKILAAGAPALCLVIGAIGAVYRQSLRYDRRAADRLEPLLRRAARRNAQEDRWTAPPANQSPPPICPT